MKKVFVKGFIVSFIVSQCFLIVFAASKHKNEYEYLRSIKFQEPFKLFEFGDFFLQVLTDSINNLPLSTQCNSALDKLNLAILGNEEWALKGININ